MAPPRHVIIFNDQFKSLLSELLAQYPDDADLKTFQLYSSQLVKTTPRKPMELFNVYVVGPYRDGIVGRQESMFLEQRYVDQSGNEFDFVPKIKKYWASMSDENKNVIWNYLFVLMTLVESFLKEGNTF